MAERVVLHVGLMKSGTTFIQGRLNANRAQLADQGILFPGPNWARHSRGVTDLLELPQAKPGSWASLRDEIAAHPGTAIISMEYLGPIIPAKIAKVVSQFPDTDLQIVLTVRDLGRCVPAMWQETVKNRRTWTWSEYVRGIEKGGDAGKAFWRQQGAGKITRRWADAVGAEQVTVVVVPPPGAPHELLWDRFCQTAGIAPGTWAEAARANESLGVASALLMRRLNAATGDLSRQQYKKRVKSLAKHSLVHHRRDEDSIGFTVPAWLRANAQRMRKAIVDSGVHVVGDLAELEPVDVPGVDPGAVPAEQELEAAVKALAVVLSEGGRAFKPRQPTA